MSPAPAAALGVCVGLPADTPVLQGLRLVSHAPGEALAQALQTSCPGIWEGLGWTREGRSGERISPERKPLQGPLDISEKLFCSTCDQTFQNHQEQREHYKLDWHQFNLKQHLKDKPLLSALDFEKQSSTGDLSSISGSEDSDLASEEDLQILDEERAEFEKPNRPRGFHPHRVLFQNTQGQFLYAYCCVLGPRQASASTGCVVNSSLLQEVLTHKTFHCYTVRAKWGTAQGLRDAWGAASCSAGANLRRCSEAMLYKDVRDLLAGPDWAKVLEKAGTILMRAPHSGRSLFFGGREAPLQRGDPRLWVIPLATRRPTFQELQLRERKAIEEERKVRSDENEALGRNEEAPKQDGSNIANFSLGSESEGEDGSQVELELVEVTLGMLVLREFEVLPKQRRRKRNKRERNQDLEAGAQMTVSQQPQEDEAFSESAPLGPSPDEAKSPARALGCAFDCLPSWRWGMLKLRLAASPLDPGVLSLLSAPLGSGGFTLLHAAAAAGRGSVRTLGPSHCTQLQLTNQHVMSSGGSWRRIQTLMITAKLRATDSPGGAAGHSEKGAEGSPAAPGGAAAEAAGAEAGAGRAAEICCPQRLREGSSGCRAPTGCPVGSPYPSGPRPCHHQRSTPLELWDIPPRPHIPFHYFDFFPLHMLPPGSSLSGWEALFLISYSSTWGQL
eukprot:bmy_13377T0